MCIEQTRQVCLNLAYICLHWQPIMAVTEGLFDLDSDLLYC